MLDAVTVAVAEEYFVEVRWRLPPLADDVVLTVQRPTYEVATRSLR